MRKSKRSEIRNAKKALELLDVFFADPSVKDDEQRRLWNVLSALRGPDVAEASGLKADTTEVIRTAAFPRVRKIYLLSTIPASFAEADDVMNTSRLYDAGNSSHFARHIETAQEALQKMGKMVGDVIVTPRRRSK